MPRKNAYNWFIPFLIVCPLLLLFFVPGTVHSCPSGSIDDKGAFQECLPLSFSLFVSPEGSDSNPGTEDRPFHTINKAAETAQAGDVVLVKKGVYREVVTFENSGTEEYPIFFVAEPGVLVDGVMHTYYWGGIFQIDGFSYITVSGFHLNNSNWFGVYINDCSHITIDSCFVENTNSSGVFICHSDHITIKNNKIRNACFYEGDPDDKEWFGSHECITISGVDTFEVINNEVYDSSSGFSGGEGIDSKDACVHGEIAYNVVHDNVRLGIYVECWNAFLSDVRVHSNIVYNNYQGIAVSSEAGGTVKDVAIYNNLVFNNAYNGIIVSAWSGVNETGNGPRENISIICNTVVTNGDEESEWWDESISDYAGGIAVEPNANAKDITIRNNIISGNLKWQLRGDLTSEQDIICDHNLIDGFRGIYLDEIRGDAFQEGDPGFMDRVANNYALKPTSIAIDTGSLLEAPMEDRLENPRPQGVGIDIGAYEYTEPIYINGNTDFSAVASARKWPGDGTSSIPYVIEGLTLSGTANNLIEIRNTDVHFQISDCLISDGSFGIYLSNVQNGHINENNIINHEYDGIFLVDGSTNCVIDNNSVSNTSAFGIHLRVSDHNNISYNRFSNHLWSGIALNNSNSNIIINNSASNANSGVEVRSSDMNTISHNVLHDNVFYGIILDSGSIDNAVQWNDFTGNNEGNTQVADDGQGNTFDSNHYEDWTGTGSYAIDGSTGNQDLAPLINPYHLSSPVITYPTSDIESLEDSVTIQWSVSKDLFCHSISYEVFYSTTNGVSWTELASGKLTTSYLWDLSSLTDDTKVFLKVQATDSVGFNAFFTSPSPFIINPALPTTSSSTTTTTTTTAPSWNFFFLFTSILFLIAFKRIKYRH